ncbi:MAG: lysoplasmalogenase [Ruminococcaceae bacterium]|nr:lysoplasmalogenase [Oscillospiraceae bacterium]
MEITFIFYAIIVLIGLISLCAFLFLRVKKTDVKSLMLKAVTSVMFILTGVFLTIVNTSLYAGLIVAGLTCGILGDIWLDMKFMYRQDEKFLTNAGFISFACGHFFYIAAIIAGTAPSFKVISLLPSIGIALIAGCAVYFGEKLMKLNYGSYKIISTLYGALLFFVTVLALFACIFSGFSANTHLFVFFIGGVLFVISDLILSGTYFGEGKNRPVDIITNHVSYYLAQFVIASSILFM